MAVVGAICAQTPAERIAALIGKFVCEEIGLDEFVQQYPSILPTRIMDGKNLLHAAVQTNDEDLVKRVIRAGFHRVIDHRDEHRRWSPLSYAAHQKNLRILDILLEAGADPSRGGPLLFASANDEACALRLIAAGADPNDTYAETEETCLHCAARGGSIYVVHQLLKVGADPTAKNSLNQTPAIVARDNGHADIMDLLLIAEARWPEVVASFEICRIRRSHHVANVLIARREAERKAAEEAEAKRIAEEEAKALAEEERNREKEEKLKELTEVKKTKRIRLRTLRIDKKNAPITDFSNRLYNLAGFTN